MNVSPTPMDTPRARPELGCLLVCMVLIAYIPSMAAGWIWDDDQHVSQSRAIRASDGLGRIWFEIGATPQYYPLVFTSFWVEHRIWGQNPTGYHMTNVLLHAANAWLVWLILLRLRVPGAWLAAAVFALHPVHVESVAWISERKNVLSGLFYLSALLMYLRFMETRSFRWYFLSLASLLCALLSKTVTCTLPVIIVLILWWQRGRVARRDWMLLVPFFVVGIDFGLVTAWLEKHAVGAAGYEWSLTPWQRGLVAGRAVWFYAGKLVWPVPLVFIYPRWDLEGAPAWWYLYPAAALAVVAGLWLARHRLGKGPLVAVLAFSVTLFPALGFFDVYPFRFSFVADHFQYLASISLIALGAAAACHWLRERDAARLAAAGVLAALGVLTFRQGLIYRSERALWEVTLVHNEDCALAHAQLGMQLAAARDFRGASDHFAAVVRRYPDSFENQLMYANYSALARRWRTAASAYRAAIALRGDSAEAWSGLAEVMQAEGNRDEAARCFEEAVRYDQKNADLHNSLGVARSHQGRWGAAATHFAEAVRLAPTNAAFQRNLQIAKQKLTEKN